MKDINTNDQKKLFEKIQTLCKNYTWKYNLLEVYVLIKKEYNDPDPANPEITIPEIRQSLIQMIQVPDLEKFYKKLNLLLDTNFDLPVAHLTLFTTSTRADKLLRGI